MKNNQYRCSCCNEVKSKFNIVYKLWESRAKAKNCTPVGVCRSCNNQMKKVRIKRVSTFIEYQARGFFDYLDLIVCGRI